MNLSPGPVDHPCNNTFGRVDKCPQQTQVIVSGMVAWAVVLVLTFFLPLSVTTVSVTWTVTETTYLQPVWHLESLDSTPAEDSFSPLGRVTFFHLKVVT